MTIGSDTSFFNLEHLLRYINNVQIQLNINTQKLQSSFLILRRKKNPTTSNIRVQHNYCEGSKRNV
jgi:hypothetical protein